MKVFARGCAAAVFAVATASAYAQDHVVTLIAKDGRFDPPNLEVPAGKRIKIEVSNQGTTPVELESKALRIEKVLAPGAKSSVLVNALKPGEYPFFDEFHPDTSRGKIVAK